MSIFSRPPLDPLSYKTGFLRLPRVPQLCENITKLDRIKQKYKILIFWNISLFSKLNYFLYSKNHSTTCDAPIYTYYTWAISYMKVNLFRTIHKFIMNRIIKCFLFNTKTSGVKATFVLIISIETTSGTNKCHLVKNLKVYF